MKRVGAILYLVVVLTLIATPVFAQDPALSDAAASVTTDPATQLVITLLEKVMSGDWAAVAATVIAIVTYLSRAKKSPLQKWILKLSFNRWDIKKDRGGAILVLVLGLAGGLVTAFTAGSPITVALLVTCLKESVMAAGGYVLIKKIFFPGDTEEEAKTAEDATVKEAQAAAVTPVDPNNSPLNQ